MKSIREIYKIGKGPSSSHTMGPEKAAKILRETYPNADAYKVILYGSLAQTGKGHGTDVVMEQTLAPVSTKIIFNFDDAIALPHPNTMDLFAFKDQNELGHMRIVSIGGGDIRVEGSDSHEPAEIYKEKDLAEIIELCKRRRIRLSEYVEENEGPEIWDFLFKVWNAMSDSIQQGLTHTGILPGGLNVERKAQLLYNQRHIDESPETRENRIVCSYAFAVGEQNASQGTVVTAPTCGACGTLPAVLKYMQDAKRIDDRQILRALAVGGIIGNVIKTNASVSGAECGCQAEIGSACSMASAALGELFEMGLDQIEYAAEVAMEHYLGLTCDPICGLVQIPCIERNAVAAMRAINAVRIANFLTSTRKISFDMVVRTMYKTGMDMNRKYRETSQGGLAEEYGGDHI